MAINLSVYVCEFLSVSVIMSEICKAWKGEFSNASQPWYVRHSYEILMVVFQSMVMFFKSSLICFKLKKIPAFLIPVVLCFCALLIQSLFNQLFPFWIVVIIFAILGTFSGISFCNLNYLVISSPTLDQSEKVKKITKGTCNWSFQLYRRFGNFGFRFFGFMIMSTLYQK